MKKDKFESSSPSWRRLLARKLLSWFKRHARDLPWRRTRDLYAIWISEIMLQQTQVVTVIPFYERFLGRFPDINSLAAAPEHDVLKLWEGLGYYRRARQLHAAAKTIVTDYRGRFPNSIDAVRSLPGIGRYTAGAILSIGLDQRLPILEANTIRVLSRLIAYRGDPRSAAGQQRLWAAAESILPSRDCGPFNQALMELGSEICTPRMPRCAECPVRAICTAHQRRAVHQIPRPPTKTNYENVSEIAVVIRRGQRVLLRQCQPGERWAGLWDFPRFPARDKSSTNHQQEIAAQTRDLVGIKIQAAEPLATLKHGVTRFRITLHCYEATAAPSPNGRSRLSNRGVRWVKINDLADYPLSVTGRKISRLLGAQTTSTP
jgi:A/G-specific adenine glycosylase